MADINHSASVLRLPITGRSGDRRILRDWATVVDDALGRSLLKHSWCFDSYGYPSRHNTTVVGKCTIYLHQVVFEHYHGHVPDGTEIDHISRDKLDAHPDNLRAVIHARNVTNVGKRRDNSSGFVGVHWYKRCRRWGAAIQADGRRIYLGVFLDAREAAAAVNRAYSIHKPHIEPPNRID